MARKHCEKFDQIEFEKNFFVIFVNFFCDFCEFFFAIFVKNVVCSEANVVLNELISENLEDIEVDIIFLIRIIVMWDKIEIVMGYSKRG